MPERENMNQCPVREVSPQGGRRTRRQPARKSAKSVCPQFQYRAGDNRDDRSPLLEDAGGRFFFLGQESPKSSATTREAPMQRALPPPPLGTDLPSRPRPTPLASPPKSVATRYLTVCHPRVLNAPCPPMQAARPRGARRFKKV